MSAWKNWGLNLDIFKILIKIMSYKYSRDKRWETTWRRSSHHFAQNYRVEQSRFYCSERVKAKKYSHSKHKLDVISYVAGNGINITATAKEPKHSISSAKSNRYTSHRRVTDALSDGARFIFSVDFLQFSEVCLKKVYQFYWRANEVSYHHLK